MGRWYLRLRSLLDRQFRVFVSLLIVLALFTGWMTVGAYTPETTTTEQTVSSWSMTGEYNHSATVTEPNPVHPVGTTLSNRPVYLLAASPVVNGSLQLTYEASDNETVDVAIQQAAVIRSVDEQRGETVEMWRHSRPLANNSWTAVSPGTSVAVPFSLNVTEVRNRTERVERALGNPPGTTRFAVVTTVTVTGTLDGREVDRTEEYLLPVSFSDSAYRPNATATTEQFETTETVTVSQQPSVVETTAWSAVFVVSLGSLSGLVYKRDAFGLSDAQRDRLQFDVDRKTLDEWIHRMTLPDEVYERERIHAASLADLVDFAIDTNNSVIQDDDYYVLHDRMLYTYEAAENDTSQSEDSGTIATDTVSSTTSHSGQGDSDD